MTTTFPHRPTTDLDYREEIERLSNEARVLWRSEPPVDGRTRLEVMRELAAVRLVIEAVERRQLHSRLDVEDARSLHYCASRIAELREHWNDG